MFTKIGVCLLGKLTICIDNAGTLWGHCIVVIFKKETWKNHPQKLLIIGTDPFFLILAWLPKRPTKILYHQKDWVFRLGNKPKNLLHCTVVEVLQYEKIEPSRSNNNDVFLPGLCRATMLAYKQSAVSLNMRSLIEYITDPAHNLRFRYVIMELCSTNLI
jgi:hypothetical protein